MRKLKLQVQISIDGFIAGTQGDMDWMEWNWGDDINGYVGALTEPVSTIVLGRKLAEGFIPYWEQAGGNEETAGAAKKMNETPKVVFTHTLTNHSWPLTSLATGDVADEIAKLKAQDGGDIIVYGGADFVSSLIKGNLIDEYYLFVNPVAVGSGMPIFKELNAKLHLQLAEARAFTCGIAVLHYTKNK